ncbi:uncharacterized protein K02A2.6-like [Ornithodoros turicata]|uniref:uncharacterized protein K02A2.6-like n=1 Tax=Ornithodoros turicata TaxID=34597 RepID=UPI00313923FC
MDAVKEDIVQKKEVVPYTEPTAGTNMATIGQVENFDETISDWISYEERLSSFLKVNKIGDDRKVDAFLSIIGPKTYTLLKTLLAPEKPSDKTLDDLMKVLRDHLSPKPSVIAERAKFHKYIQGEAQTIVQFVAELKRLAQDCKFGANLEETLRDRFVCGLHRLDIQKCLFAENESLTFKKAVEKALSLEMATKSASECHAADTPPRLNKIDKPERRKKRFCYRCGGSNHASEACNFRDAVCHRCKRKGHIKGACQSGTKVKPAGRQSLGNLKEENDWVQNNPGGNAILRLESHKNDPMYATVSVEDVPLTMEIDTGAAVSVMSLQQYQNCFPHLTLEPTSLRLRTYTGEALTPQGYITVNVNYGGRQRTLPLHILRQPGVPLLGRNWVRELRLDWAGVNTMSLDVNTITGQLTEKYKPLFTEELGKIKGEQACLKLKEGSTPRFLKARSLPFSLRNAVENEINKLEKMGVISPTSCSAYGTPVVPVVKKDGSVRLCGDYRTTLNQVLEVEKYPLPRFDEIFAALAGGKYFSKIDLNRAYLQVEVDEQSSRYLTLNTHKGLYKVNRLAFGITSAPAIFQRIMDNMLKDLDGVIVYLDDILVMGRSEQEHIRNLERVLQRLMERGVRIKRGKCEFLKTELQYLGHVINAEGVKPSKEKVEAVLRAPAPTDKQQLRSLLGVINFYGKFLPDLSSVLYPLHRLLKLKVAWSWNQQCQMAFNRVKELLASPPVLVHYDPDAPLQLECDASAFGVGAVLSHIQEDGSVKPIAYASRTLSTAEANYSHLEKEALALIFGVKKFHSFLYGREFVLLTDHKPLQTIFGEKSSTPTIAAARLQRWSLILAAYRYELRYRAGKANVVADCFSRLPLQRTQEDDDDEVSAIYSLGLESFPVNCAEIAKETARDRVLSVVAEVIAKGWPATINDEALKPYFSHRTELTIHQGCILWGMRVLIPSKLRTRVLDELHCGHPGIVRMKEIARSYTWWPRIDDELEQMVKRCDDCQEQRPQPPKAPLHPWSWPSRPWDRVHLDFAGPFLSKNFLVAVDAHSKWPEVFVLQSTTAAATIQCVRELFTRWGIAGTIVTDNGPQFCAESFQMFLKQNGVKHITSAPYHPSSNGLAERFIRTLKEGLKKDQSHSLEVRLSNLLLVYRNTPHATTAQSPASLMLGRPLRTRLDLMKPSLDLTVRQKQVIQSFTRSPRGRVFQVGDPVRVRNYRGGEKWVMGNVVERTGPVSYRVKVNCQNGTLVWRRHADQMITADVPAKKTAQEESSDLFPSVPSGSATFAENATATVETPPSPQMERRYPSRVRKPPDRYQAT